MARPPRPEPRKLPMQARSRALYAALLTASAELLERDGPEFALSDVAMRAGVSPGSLYQYFPDREALVAALIDWQIERDRAGIAAWTTHASVHDVDLAAALSDGLLALYGERPALMSQMVAVLEQVGRVTDVQAVLGALCAELALLLQRRTPERALAACREASDAAVFGTLAIVRQAAQENPKKLGELEFRARLIAVARAALD